MPGDDRDRDEPSMIKLTVWFVANLRGHLAPDCTGLGFGIVLQVFCPRCRFASASYMTWDEFDI